MEEQKSKTENRYRNHQIHLRLTEEEYQYLLDKVKLAECKNINDFYIRLLHSSNIYKMNWDDFNIPKLSAEISKIASNVNQIRKRLNETGHFYTQDVEEIQKGYSSLWQLLASILSKLQSKKL